jgi:hypothetical protein
MDFVRGPMEDSEVVERKNAEVSNLNCSHLDITFVLFNQNNPKPESATMILHKI